MTQKTKKQYSHEKSAGAVVFRRDHVSPHVSGEVKYLLLHYLSGHWDFPKGHIEEGESEIETLKREIEEETGIGQLKIVPEFKMQVAYAYVAGGEEKEKRIKKNQLLDVKKQVVYYLAETDQEEVAISHEHTGFVWLSFEDALRKITFENSKNVLKKANEFLANK